MALPKHETFTAANQQLSTYDANWADLVPVAGWYLQIVSNQLGASSGVNDAFSYWVGDTFSADHCCQATTANAQQAFLSLGVRLAGNYNAGNIQGYAWSVSEGRVAYFSSAGVKTDIATAWTTCTTDGAVCKLVIAGNVITGYINGVQAGTVTDSTYTTGGSPGLGVSAANNARWDEWYGNNGTDPTSAGAPVNNARIVFRKA